jgi:hypothetical protein
MRAALLLCLASLLLFACGGRQNRATVPAWEHVFDVVPADVSWVLAWRTVGDPPQGLTAPGSGTELLLMAQDMLPASIFERLDSNPSMVDVAAALGIDPRLEYAFFSPSAAPVVTARLFDTERFDQMLRDLGEEGAEPLVLGGYPFFRVLRGGETFDIGRVGSWLFVRTGRPGVPGEVDDTLLLRVLQGNPTRSTLHSGLGATLAARVPVGDDMTSLVWVRTDRLWRMWQWLRADGSLGAMLPVDVPGLNGPPAVEDAWTSPTQQRLCLEGAERFALSMPTLGAVSWQSPDGTRMAGDLLVQFNQATADRLRPAFSGALADVPALAPDAVLAGAGRIGAQTLLDSVLADPALATCPNIAALPGTLRATLEANRRRIEQNLRLYDGGGALILYQLAPAGFGVQASFAATAQAPNPGATGDNLQRVLRSLGFRGTAVPESAIPRIDFDSFLLPLTLFMGEDRIAVVTPDVQPNVYNPLITRPAGGPDSPFLDIRVNGPPLQTMVTGIQQYLVQTGFWNPNLDSAFRPMLETIGRIRHIDMVGRMEGSLLVLHQDAHFTDAP